MNALQRSFVILVTGLVVALGSTPGRAQTVMNGSFESPRFSAVPGGFGYQPTGAGWVFTPFSGIVASMSPGWGFPTPPDGNQCAVLQSWNGTNSEIS